jgi:hypothetical protein
MKLLRNVSVKISFKSLQIALIPPRRRGQPCSFIMYSAADYVEMLIIYGECGNEVNPHALFSRAFQQRFYINLWVGLLRNRVVCLQLEISLHVS